MRKLCLDLEKLWKLVLQYEGDFFFNKLSVGIFFTELISITFLNFASLKWRNFNFNGSTSRGGFLLTSENRLNGAEANCSHRKWIGLCIGVVIQVRIQLPLLNSYRLQLLG